MGNILRKRERPPEHEPLVQKESFTCEICIEPVLLPNKIFNNNNNCTHLFCPDCIVKYIQIKPDDKVAEIPCPAMNCKQFLDPFSCEPLVGTQLIAQWCDVLCENALLKMDRCYCPNTNCSLVIVNECGDNNVTQTTCPNCRTMFCFKCKLPWHAGLSCDRNIDFAFDRLAKQKLWKRCPRCHYYVERKGGCRRIYCKCGASFCYYCGGNEYPCRCIENYLAFDFCDCCAMCIMVILIGGTMIFMLRTMIREIRKG